MINKKHYLCKEEKRHRLLRVPFILILLIVPLSFYSCNGNIKKYKHADIGTNNLYRIAVLPLENLTDHEYADEKIRSLVIMDLLARDVNVIEPGEVMRAIRELRIKSAKSISGRDIQSLGDLLDVDVILKGSVGTFEMKKGTAVSYPEVSVHLMLLGVKTGDIVWSAWHTSGGASFWTRHFGAEGKTLDDTARKVIKEAFDSLF
jgi:hypothetical protein